MSDKLRVIIYRDHGLWLAQALEHDICVQADSLDDLYGRFEVSVRLERVDGKLDHIAPAPAHFQRMWDKKAGSYKPDASNDDHYEMALAA